MLTKEIPLLSKLLIDNSGKAEDIMFRIREVGKLKGFNNHNSQNKVNHQPTDNQATKYSNLSSENVHFDTRKIAAQENLESSKASDQYQNIQGATELGNSNADEIYNFG